MSQDEQDKVVNERGLAPAPPQEAPHSPSPKVILAIAPESSGARLLTSGLTQHPGTVTLQWFV